MGLLTTRKNLCYACCESSKELVVESGEERREMKQWLAERLQVLLPRLAVLGASQEEEIRRLCEEEIAYWRSRPTMNSLRSLATPMIDARNAIQDRLEVTPTNSWVNPRTNQQEHLARRYLNFSPQEWSEIHRLAEEGVQVRLEGQLLLDHPQAILAQAEQLLHSEHWEDLAVGLIVTTGRRLLEILKTARFSLRSAWTVEFEAQSQRRSALLAPYEIPTLVEASLVLASWKRLRTLLDCQELENKEAEQRYGALVRDAAERSFRDLVPRRISQEESSSLVHLLRAVYGRLAVWLFCPPKVNALVYQATVAGYYWVLRAQAEGQRSNVLSTLDSDGYRVGDGQGHVDGRQGIRLGEPGVQILTVFQESAVLQEQKKGRFSMQKQGTASMSKTGYSMLKPKRTTADRIEAIAQERELDRDDEVLALLVDTYRLFEQTRTLLDPVASAFGTTTSLDTLKALLATGGQRPEAAIVDAYLWEHWQTSLPDLEALLGNAQGETSPVPILLEQFERLANAKERAKKHQQTSEQTDLSQLSMAQLKQLSLPEATTERIRRAVAAIMTYNQEATHELDRWFIRQKEIKTLASARGERVTAYLREHREEIDRHHTAYQLTAKYNQKPFPITHYLLVE